QQGQRVHGVVQAPQTYSHTGARQMTIIDVADDRRITISQDRGGAARGCCVDPAALADASAILRRASDDSADLAVINRYGKLEIEGEGFAADMLTLMSTGIPVLTAVKSKHLDAWRDFTGGMAVELQPNETALRDWYTNLSR